MFFNQLKLTIRNLIKYKTISVIITSGLAVGISVFTMIYLYIDFELEFDRFNKNAHNIYRVVTDIHLRNGQNMHLALSSSQLAEPIANEFPEIETSARLFPVSRVLISIEKKRKVYEDNIWYADSNFFKIFSFELVSGNADKVLRTPDEILLNESMARKYFGEEDPIGRIVTMHGNLEKRITGVFKDHPRNSHIQVNMLASGYNFSQFNRPNWGALSLYTYLLLNENSSPSEVEKKIPKFLEQNIGEWAPEVFDVQLQPLTSIHLYSDFENDVTLRNDINKIYILSAIALLILIVACINFMNLSTAKASKRTKEIGLRKVLGAGRRNLIKQFLGESITLALVSAIVGIILIKLFLPLFNDLIDTELSFDLIDKLPLLFVIMLSVGILSGIYPAVYLSSLLPADVLREKSLKGKRGGFVRKGLVVFQFSVTVALMVASIVVTKQMEYLRTKNLGFQKDQILSISIESNDLADNVQVLKNELKKLPGVINSSAVSNTPFYGTWQRGYEPKGLPENNGALIVHTYFVDYDYLNTLEINLIDGRGFNKEYGSDAETGCIINEAAVDRFGWRIENAVGKTISWKLNAAQNDTADIYGRVIGVVNNFNFQTLHSKIEPLVLRMDNEKIRSLLVKISGENIQSTTERIKSLYESMEKEFPFEHSFLDENFESLYRREIKLGRTFIYFSEIAVLIACMGLFALASFTIEQKTKEIGVRKVLGASAARITYQIGKEFSFLVILSNIIAWPVSYFIMNRWLNNFAYRIDLDLWIFIIAGMAAFIISIITVGYNSLKAASISPAVSLRTE